MTSDLPIRARRAAFNRAIAEGDAGAIGPILARDCVMVTGSDSAVIAGRHAQVKVWKREFSAEVRLSYSRLPDVIALSEVEPIAHEQGRWEGIHTGTGARAAMGIYTAKWRDTGDGDWVIEAEIFVTLG